MSSHELPDPALVRFVTAGLLATVESYLDGRLPLPRLARELQARTAALTALGPPSRTSPRTSTRLLTRLRWLHRDVARLDAELRVAGRTGPDPHERARLAATLGTLRNVLARTDQPEPTHEWVTSYPGFGYRMG